MSHTVTIIDSIKPAVVRKKYTLTDDGIKKTVIASITEGVGVSREIATAREFAALLAEVTASESLVICSGEWMGAGIKPFRIIPEEELARILQSRVGEVAGGVIQKDGQRISARLKRGIWPSVWVLFDADNPPGMPSAWAAMSIAERLAMWEPILPGIASCERIELRGSSARVRRAGEPGQAATHAWIKVSDASKIGLMKAHIGVEMVNRGLSFPFEKLSRSPKTKGKVIGIEHRGLFDLAVFDTGRLVFCAQPDVSEAPGYVCDDAAITIVNEGGGILDLAFLTIPDKRALERYADTTGISLEIKATPNGGGLSVVSSGQLTKGTEITRRGSTQPLEAWAADMKPGDKLRCEAPFRESYSEAAFIRIAQNGEPFVYDVGNGTTYRIAEDWADDAAGAEDFDATGPDSDTKSETGGKKPAVVMTAADFLSRYVPADYIIDGLLLRGALYSLTAPTGTGKTAVALLLMQRIAAGSRFADRECEPGAVLYCAGENPDDLRHRMIAAKDNDFDGLALDRMHVYEPRGPQSLLERVAEIRAYAEAIGGLRLVIVDTAAAFFTGDNENDNTQAGNYARELRAALCGLPGRPCVLVLAHPIKRPANALDCLPRGGGAFIAEVDGNLTLWGIDGEITLHWAGKFRGPEFPPIALKLEAAETSSVLDAKGRPVKAVVAREGSQQDAEDAASRRQREVEQLMMALSRIGRARGPLQLGQAAGLLEAGGKAEQRNAYQAVVSHVARLKADGLLGEAGGLIEITARGRKWVGGLTKAGGESDHF